MGLLSKADTYIGNVKEAISQFVNAATGGYADEMLSARCYRTHNWLETPLNCVFGRDHCKLMYQCEWHRKGQHPHYSRCPEDIHCEDDCSCS